MASVIGTIIATAITAFSTYLVTKIKVTHEVEAKVSESKHNMRSKEIEAQSTSEGLYIKNMELIMQGFKEQVDDLKDDVKQLRDENSQLKSEFDEFRKKHHEEIREYKSYVKVLREENNELKEEVIELELFIEQLKGDD